MTDPQRTITQVIAELSAEIRNEAVDCRKGAGVPCQSEYSWHASTYEGWADRLDDLAAVLSGSREQETIMVSGATTNQSEAINQQRPTAGNPDIWCDVCNSWRYTQPCGRDECPR
jgi:hypothetical protein